MKRKPFIPPLTKKNLLEFDQAQAVGWVLERAISIEIKINYIIMDFFEPKKDIIFMSRVLNSSVISYGGKLKVLHSIIGYEKEERKLISNLQKLGSIRNAFAHTKISYITHVYLGEGKFVSEWNEQVIDVMNSNGKVDSKCPVDFLIDYLKLLEIIEPKLEQIHDDVQLKSD